jgi:hypothetical protein
LLCIEKWENNMKQPVWASVYAIVVAVTALLLLPLQARADRDWEFSVGAFGGKAFHSNEEIKFNAGAGTGFGAVTAHGVNLNDSPTFGAKITAWHLPRQYKWQPQIGLELDYTKFTADLDPQITGATGTSFTPGFEAGSVIFTQPVDLSVNILAANLLFRYPIWQHQRCRRVGGIPMLAQESVCSALTSRTPSFHIKKQATPQPSKVSQASRFSFFETLLSSGNGKELQVGPHLLTTGPELHRDSARSSPSLQIS